MTQILAHQTYQSDAYNFGLMIGGFIYFSLFILSIYSIAKAIKIKSKGWIACGLFGGVFIVIQLVAFISGFIGAFTENKRKSEINEEQFRKLVEEYRQNSSKTKPITGIDISYTIDAPHIWQLKRKENDFDILLSHKSAYIGVIAEEASLGTPDNISKIAIERLKENASSASIGSIEKCTIDGRTWNTFTAHCKMGQIELTYKFHCYSGAEGTFQVVSWTTPNLVSKYENEMNSIAGSFKFPRK